MNKDQKGEMDGGGGTRLMGMLEAALIVSMMDTELSSGMTPDAAHMISATCEEAIERIVRACPELETVLDNFDALRGTTHLPRCDTGRRSQDRAAAVRP